MSTALHAAMVLILRYNNEIEKANTLCTKNFCTWVRVQNGSEFRQYEIKMFQSQIVILDNMELHCFKVILRYTYKNVE